MGPLTCSLIPLRTTIPCQKHLFDVRLCPMITCSSSTSYTLVHSFFDKEKTNCPTLIFSNASRVYCLGLTLHLRLNDRMEFIYTLCTCNTLHRLTYIYVSVWYKTCKWMLKLCKSMLCCVKPFECKCKNKTFVCFCTFVWNNVKMCNF